MWWIQDLIFWTISRGVNWEKVLQLLVYFGLLTVCSAVVYTFLYLWAEWLRNRDIDRAVKLAFPNDDDQDICECVKE